jgi:PleD family two-component response regulator
MITADIDEVYTTKNTITFDVFVVDDNTVSTANLQAVLYDEFDVAVVGVSPEAVLVGENTIVFTLLLSDVKYTVKIETDYDLELNGVAPVTAGVLTKVDVLTLPLDHPGATITIDSAEVDNTRIEFDVNVVDNDSTITQELRALLYKDGVYEITLMNSLTILNLVLNMKSLS